MSAITLPLLFALAALLTGPASAADAPAGPASRGPGASADKGSAAFATVGDTVVTVAEYERALAVAMRRKYYHAKPPEAELARFQREIGDEVVNRVLIVAEARRRGVQPDRAQIDATVAGYDAQYGNSPAWKTNREQMLQRVRPELERESVLTQIEQQVRDAPPPSDADARRYYDQNRSLFVEPEQVKLSVILLKVDPSSAQAVWNSAMAEGRDLHRRLLAGADFAGLARLHSGDNSAASGGQMDYTHRGMLPEAVHAVVDKLQPGHLSEPVQLLEGVAILRLDGRKPAVQRSFEQVRERAGELWRRDASESRWKDFIAGLRRAARIRVDESHYAPLPPATEKARAS